MSSKRRKRRRTCESKIPYASESAANAARKAVNAKRYTGPMRVYLCRFCKKYHIGHFRSRKRAHR